jgi:thiamine biosynthesis protein ThiI
MTLDPGAEPEILLVRYGELGLKGRNRIGFERALIANIRAACEPVAPLAIERRQGRIAVFPERRPLSVARRLQDVFGIASISPAWGAPLDAPAIAEVARTVLARALDEFPPTGEITVRVRTTRGDKRFPMSSSELDVFVADRVLGGDPRLKVQLARPALTLGIDVRSERAYVFASRLRGPGGLPVGTQGRGVCLVSGGIDSPVAAWMAMKRGLALAFATFHSHPFIGESARKKVVDIVRTLARFQPRTRLYVVPFAEIQVALRDAEAAPLNYRTVLYRRMMHRIASRIARRERAKALVTGESLGQVASQTLENLACIGDAASMPVLRPLIGFDKQETVDLAHRIGTFALSALPEPDCCTLFMPNRPIIRGEIATCERAEAELDIEGWIESALARTEIVDLEPAAGN